MGTQIVPSYTNIFMDDLEKWILASMEKNTLDMVEVYWWNFCCLVTWPRTFENIVDIEK